MAVIDNIKARAKKDIKTIILPETNDDRIIKAAAKTVEEGIAKIILLGDENELKAKAEALGVDISGVTFINPPEAPKLDEYANIFYEVACATYLLNNEFAVTLVMHADNLPKEIEKELELC